MRGLPLDEDRLSQLLKDAMGRPIGERDDFLARACAGDTALLRRASLLLASVTGCRAGADEILPSPTIPVLSGLSPGQRLGGRYRVEQMLGRGGMGEVWSAFDEKLRVDVALKSLLPELSANARHVEALRREVRAARTVSSPHVCRVFDLLEIGGQELVSMEYVEGTTLHALLAERAPLDIAEAGEIAAQILDGLDEIHAAGLIHRDLKPANVMITAAGRAVIMDLGLARHVDETVSVAMAGTPAYMAPEQLGGQELGPGVDLYAMGFILAEMTSRAPREGIVGLRELWEGLRRSPAAVPEGAWEGVIRKAVSSRPEDRYRSATDLALALGDRARPVLDLAEGSPYPGLAAFTEADEKYFFGRDVEIDALWQRIGRLQMLALIGPSGAGKSSFLRAGILPARPAGWACAVCTPGASPFVRLAEALAPDVANDATLVRDLLHISEPETAVRFFREWRRGREQAFLILDQFEELFTLNPPEVRRNFADILGRVALEADVRVLLSMRDDFFFHCHDHPSLAPAASEVMMLGPLGERASREALVEPARMCGYRFEDEDLVEEILGDAARDRGTLPLLAFAAAQMWSLRDRERGLLTRDAYASIGGVAGGLAMHAERTLERIGRNREDTVREIFRNLVTAEYTRVDRDRDELLTVFEDRESAGEVLDVLVDARLLTSFEATGDGERGGCRRQRIEIVHESLLRSWPRLVRWQTQDADGAQLRDELRHAAQVWSQRGRNEDLLWSGTAYRDFALWQERYPGHLTDVEEQFAVAMRDREARRRRMRRLAGTLGVAVLLGVIAVIGYLRWSAVESRELAELQKRRVVVNRILGEVRAEPDPTRRLALATAGLRIQDDSDLRTEALRALFEGPTWFGAPKMSELGLMVPAFFSPDGNWLATAGYDSGIVVYPSDGSAPIAGWGNRALPRDGAEYLPWPMGFSEDATTLFSMFFCHPAGAPEGAWNSRYLGAYSFPGGELRWMQELKSDIKFYATHGVINDDRIWVERGANPVWFEQWTAEGRRAAAFGPVPYPSDFLAPSLAEGGGFVAWPEANRVLVAPVLVEGLGTAVEVGRHEAAIAGVDLSASGDIVGSIDVEGQLKIWRRSPSGPPAWERGGFANKALRVDIHAQNSRIYVWVDPGWQYVDMRGPTRARARNLYPRWNFHGAPTHHPRLGWIAVPRSTNRGALWLYALGGVPSYQVRLEGGPPGSTLERPIFSPDGAMVVGDAVNATWLQRLRGTDSGPRQLAQDPAKRMSFCFAFDPLGVYVAVGGFASGARLVALDGSGTVPLAGTQPSVTSVAWSPSGDRIAVSPPREVLVYGREGELLQTVDLASTIADSQEPGVINALAFLDDHRVMITSSPRGAYILDTADGSVATINDRPHRGQAGSRLDVSEHFVLEAARSVVLYDRSTMDGRELAFPAQQNYCAVALSADESLAVAGVGGGHVFLQRLDEDRYHVLLPMHRDQPMPVNDIWIDPQGRWVIAALVDGTLHYLPVPRGRPLHDRPVEELLEVLEDQTNLRMQIDYDSPELFEWSLGPFRGFDTLPTWQDWGSDEYFEDPPWYSVWDQIRHTRGDGG